MAVVEMIKGVHRTDAVASVSAGGGGKRRGEEQWWCPLTYVVARTHSEVEACSLSLSRRR